MSKIIQCEVNPIRRHFVDIELSISAAIGEIQDCKNERNGKDGKS